MSTLNWSTRTILLRLFPLIITISFAMDVYVPAIPNMSSYFHTSSATMQTSLYLFMLAVAIAQLMIGPLADRFGRRMMALASALLFLLGSLVCAQASSLFVLLSGRVTQAMGACGTYLLCFIVVRDNYSTQICGRIFSLLGGINAIVASLAPIIGGVLLDLSGNWRSGFFFLSILGCLVVLAAFFNIPKYTPEASKGSVSLFDKTTWKDILCNRYFQQYTLIASSCFLGLYLFCALSPEILINTLNLDGTHYGFLFGLNALTVFIANLYAARCSKIHALETIVIVGLKVIIASSILMIYFTLSSLSVLRFMLPMLCMTFGIGMSMGCSVALALRDFKSLSGIATSIVSACQFATAAIIGMVVAQTNLSPVNIALPVLLLSVLGWCFTKRKLLIY